MNSMGGAAAQTGSARELDWSTLMARAQGGDRDAYRRLLGEITPYLRALAAPSSQPQ
jgi:RNA polymerase sigma-70 factor (ECF subfamily)